MGNNPNGPAQSGKAPSALHKVGAAVDKFVSSDSSVLTAPPPFPSGSDLPPGLPPPSTTSSPSSPPPSRPGGLPSPVKSPDSPALSRNDDRVTIITTKAVESSDALLLQAELALCNVPRFVPLDKSPLYTNSHLNATALLEACRIYQCHMRVTSQVFSTNQTHLRNRMRRCNEATSKNLTMLNSHFAAMRKFESQMQTVELLEKQVLLMKKTVVDVVRIASRLNNLLTSADRLATVVLLDRPLPPFTPLQSSPADPPRFGVGFSSAASSSSTSM